MALTIGDICYAKVNDISFYKTPNMKDKWVYLTEDELEDHYGFDDADDDIGNYNFDQHKKIGTQLGLIKDVQNIDGVQYANIDLNCTFREDGSPSTLTYILPLFASFIDSGSKANDNYPFTVNVWVVSSTIASKEVIEEILAKKNTITDGKTSLTDGKTSLTDKSLTGAGKGEGDDKKNKTGTIVVISLALTILSVVAWLVIRKAKKNQTK